MKKLSKENENRFEFSKKNPNDQMWHVRDIQCFGPVLFSFDKKTIYNFWEDYPQNLTPEQKEIFDKEEPFWKNFYEGKNTEEDDDEDDLI